MLNDLFDLPSLQVAWPGIDDPPLEVPMVGLPDFPNMDGYYNEIEQGLDDMVVPSLSLSISRSVSMSIIRSMISIIFFNTL